jgi:DNA topoisomerase I
MAKILIIVESPAKIKTLKKFLGSNYVIESSIGHIRDLPAKEFGIDIEHGFEPTYVTLPNKEEVVAKLKRAAKQCDMVYLSPDPDREGEAIAWHISQILPPATKIKRVTFQSITKEAVLKALQNPSDIDMNMVNAQQSRRILDRIVGYKISPLLNRRIQRGKEGYVSAGRVQSVALKLVVDREREIEAFKPVEYWNIGALLKTDTKSKSFAASLFSVDGKRVEKEAVEGKELFLIGNKESAESVLNRIKGKPFVVERVEKKEKKRNPVPPFITSTLQQEASRHHGFSSAKTMSVAQTLYEGVDVGDGAEGLITYMRTDSVRIAPEAITEVRKFIETQYGKDYLPSEPRFYSTQKSAQDAHEAIRPVNLAHSPESIKQYLTKEQFQLYLLIWRRFIASQMVPAIYDTVSVDISAGSNILFRATGSVMKFSGFLAVYEEKVDDSEQDEEGKILPPLEELQKLLLEKLTSEQAFTRPPPRFTEASLVKELEKSGIGRPSTYAAIMNKIQSRDYTIKESARLKPTELGCIITDMLQASFSSIINVGFTAEMEDELEHIAANTKNWRELLKLFWDDFAPLLETATKEAFVPKVMTDIDCPKCGSKLQKVWSKSKYFYGCSKYPDCDYSAPIEEVHFNKEEYAENFDWDQVCSLCQSPMKVRHGRFGTFLGCSKYPDCKGIINIPKRGEVVIPVEDMPKCPAIDCPGHMVARKSRYGKTFYSCSTYPECDVIGNSLDQIITKYPSHPRTPYQKAATKKGGKASAKSAKSDKGDKSVAVKATTKKVAAKKPAKKEVGEKSAIKEKAPAKKREMPSKKLSPELAAVVGKAEMTRGDVLKQLWVYIKEHHLQDEANKRLIKPDAMLTKVLGKEPVDMFQLAGLVGKHLE